MKELQLHNFELVAFHGFLLQLKLKGRQNRHRMRVVKEIQEAITNFEEEKRVLAVEFALKDENGEPVVVKEERDGQTFDVYDIEDTQRFDHERKLLEEEHFKLDAEKYEEELKTLLVAMDESETELSGNEAVVEQIIYERIETSISSC